MSVLPVEATDVFQVRADYFIWKIEQHSRVEVALMLAQRKH